MTANNANKRTGKIVYPELSYKIIGASFTVFNELGWGLSELNYQRALAKEFEKNGIDFKREVYVPVEYRTLRVGRYFADFIVDN